MFDLAESKKGLWKEIWAAGDLLACFNCSSCITGCPASESDPPLLIRNLVRKVVFGLEEDLIDDDSPWICVTCSRCEEMCPQDAKPFEIVLAIRRWQCKEDDTRIPPPLPEIYERGYTQPVEGGDMREKLELPKILTLSEFPEDLKKFQAMLMEIEIVKQNDYMFQAGA